MGDIIGILDRLNLSPVNSILLAALYFVLRAIFSRIEAMERTAETQGRSIAFIKGHLNLEEE